MIFFLVCITIVVLVILFYRSRSNEEFEIYTTDTINEHDLSYTRYILTMILESVNLKYSKDLKLGGFERMEKTFLKDAVQYKIINFVVNKKNYTNQKYDFHFTVNPKTEVITIHKIVAGKSLNYVLDRSPISGRRSTLYKPKEKEVPKDHIQKSSLESSEVNLPTLKTPKPKDRNKTIVPKEAEHLKTINYRPFPARKVDFKWNTKSISKLCKNEKNIMGNYHGRVTPKIFPNYNPTLFTGTDENNKWLFDLSQDSSSRPIGIG
jgi:hypothetical protein